MCAGQSVSGGGGPSSANGGLPVPVIRNRSHTSGSDSVPTAACLGGAAAAAEQRGEPGVRGDPAGPVEPAVEGLVPGVEEHLDVDGLPAEHQGGGPAVALVVIAAHRSRPEASCTCGSGTSRRMSAFAVGESIPATPAIPPQISADR